MKGIQSRIISLWLDCSKIIAQRFGLEAPPISKSVEVIESTSATRIGGIFNQSMNEFQIHPDTKNGIIPLAGVVYRECLYNSLPPELCPESKQDIASEFARQMLKKSDRSKWVKEWQKIPTRRVRVDLVHTSYKAMHWAITLGGPGELDSLVHEFVSLARYGKSLNYEEYVEYLNLRTRNIVVELGHADVKIVDALLKDATATYRKVAEITGLSESWVCTRINRLKKKYVLMNFIKIV